MRARVKGSPWQFPGCAARPICFNLATADAIHYGRQAAPRCHTHDLTYLLSIPTNAEKTFRCARYPLLIKYHPPKIQLQPQVSTLKQPRKKMNTRRPSSQTLQTFEVRQKKLTTLVMLLRNYFPCNCTIFELELHSYVVTSYNSIEWLSCTGWVIYAAPENVRVGRMKFNWYLRTIQKSIHALEKDKKENMKSLSFS